MSGRDRQVYPPTASGAYSVEVPQVESSNRIDINHQNNGSTVSIANSSSSSCYSPSNSFEDHPLDHNASLNSINPPVSSSESTTDLLSNLVPCTPSQPSFTEVKPDLSRASSVKSTPSTLVPALPGSSSPAGPDSNDSELVSITTSRSASPTQASPLLQSKISLESSPPIPIPPRSANHKHNTSHPLLASSRARSKQLSLIPRSPLLTDLSSDDNTSSDSLPNKLSRLELTDTANIANNATESAKTNNIGAGDDKKDSRSPEKQSFSSLDGLSTGELKSMLSEKILQLSQVQSQNAQLWSLVNKQRTMILDLKADLSAAAIQNENFRASLTKLQLDPLKIPEPKIVAPDHPSSTGLTPVLDNFNATFNSSAGKDVTTISGANSSLKETISASSSFDFQEIQSSTKEDPSVCIYFNTTCYFY